MDKYIKELKRGDRLETENADGEIVVRTVKSTGKGFFTGSARIEYTDGEWSCYDRNDIVCVLE